MRLRTITRGVGWSAALAGFGLVGGAVAVTVRHALRTPQPLTSGLPGHWDVDRKHGGSVYYSVAGPERAEPLVLLHDFYPGASNYEFRAIYERLAETWRVYAPDWLGFGMSERPGIQLTGEFYASMLSGFLRDVVGSPAVVVARGRAANIAARAAADFPALFDRLALVGPDLAAGDQLDPTAGQVATRFFQRFALGLTPYAVVSLRPILRLAAGRRSAIGASEVDDATLDHLYASAHQYGGQYGPLALMTGELDLPLQQVFPALGPAVLLVAGEHDRALPISRLERLAGLNPHADLEVVRGAGATVYQDQPKLFVFTLRRWMARAIPRHAPQVYAHTVASAAARMAAENDAAPPADSALMGAVDESKAYASAITAPVAPATPPRTAPPPAPATPPVTPATHAPVTDPTDMARANGHPPVKIVPVLEPGQPNWPGRARRNSGPRR